MLAGMVGFLSADDVPCLLHLIPRPRGLASPLDRPRVLPRGIPLPRLDWPRVAGRRDWRGSGVANLDDLVVVGGFSTKDISVVLCIVSVYFPKGF